jgi:hypothetical protein
MSTLDPNGTLGAVSMYVHILSSALDEWVTDLEGSDLIEYAILCREELRAGAPPDGGSAYTALAAEIAYDRALIAICTEQGIDAHATTFAYPLAERKRIESLLADIGVDLDSPRRRRAGNRESRGVYPNGAVTDQPKSDERDGEQGASVPTPKGSDANAAAASKASARRHPRRSLRP